MFEFGWFSSGRDEAARDLLQVVFDEIQKGSIKGRISFVFVTRERGERIESDRFIDLAESFGLKVICLSHRNFEPQLRKAGLEEFGKLGKDSPSLIEWRRKYDEQVMAKLAGYHADMIVLAGYMLILSPEMCHKYNMINLHPALPGGPKGTWQEVIWQLMEEEAKKTGVMMHLITPELDAGPPITYCEFGISDKYIQPLWDQWRAKRRKKSLQEIQSAEGENEPLFSEIRKRGLKREFPLIVATLKAASVGEFSIVNGEIMSRGRKLERGFDLTTEIERAVRTMFHFIEKNSNSTDRQFNTDCEGPISKNDNAFELAQEFIPQGGELFAKLSKYDDFLADIVKKPGYKAGDTLKLILPFFKAYGVTDAAIKDFSSRNILLVPGADAALRYIKSIMPAFIISTSYRPYVNALCEIIGFPAENTYCTELKLDQYQIPQAEIAYLKKLHDEILALPGIEIPASAVSRKDLNDDSIVCIGRLDKIFWKELPNMVSGKLLEDVNPIGGFEKADAIKRSCEKTRVELSGVMYAGDSITDTEAMKLVRNAGGLAVSFNGNRYAIKSADIACMSPNALILAALAFTFRESGAESVYALASEWDSEKIALENTMRQVLPGFSVEGVSLCLIDDSDMAEALALVSRSESFRKKVRGERIGRLG